MRLVRSSTILNTLYNTAIKYPSPANLSYLWTFGFNALICLMIQIVTGIFLAMHFAAEESLAFISVEHIMRDVNYGWFLRYVHANGASMFFIVVYVHMFRGMYYGSFLRPREGLWLVGVAILFLMILTAFIGYVLPWGQMSFWAATVITNLVSAVPGVGKDIVVWIWGGFSVNNATLNRFFSLHYLLPFVILGLVVIHVILLHEAKSNNPLGIFFSLDRNSMYPLTFVKDFYALVFFLAFFGFFVFFFPNVLGHTDNYIPANPMVTPAHIVPEWYFLPFYAILRSIPDKLTGVIALLFSILVLALMPYLFFFTEVRSLNFRPLSRSVFYVTVMFAFLLGWLGSCPAEYPYVGVTQFCTFGYFFCFLVGFPCVIFLENFFWTSESYIIKYNHGIPDAFFVERPWGIMKMDRPMIDRTS